MQDKLRLLKKFGLVLIFVIPAVVIYLASRSHDLNSYIAFAQNHMFLYGLILMTLKAFGIIYPPLPGIIFTLAALPLIGWKLAYLFDLVGSILGAGAAYYLGKKYGFSILKVVLGDKVADKIAKIKLKKQNQVEATIFFRFAIGGALSDGLAWGASLIGLKFLPFITGYAISHVITTLPVFYFISMSISFKSWFLAIFGVATAWLIIYKFKGRYFE